MYKTVLLCAVVVLAQDGVKEQVTESGGNNLEGFKDDETATDIQKNKLMVDGAVVYDAYFGTPVTTKRQSFLANVINASALCTVAVKPCNEQECRREDGTCTNPKYPSRGARLTPLPRLLPPRFGPGNSLRAARDGSELPSARLLRTTILADGYFRDHDFSILSSHIFVFSFIDNLDLFYILRYAPASDCCLANRTPNPAGANCIPIRVPPDDPYLRRAGVECMNLTRVETYQDRGCLPPTLPAERYSRVTPLLDLSVVYGNNEERSQEIRAKEGGLLAFRMEGDREVPDGNAPTCLSNQPPRESVCYNYGDPFQGNLLTGNSLTSMWFFREHNRLARKLQQINPCWDDEKLYQTARKINIAHWQYIFYYELIAEFFGYKNALADGIIYETYGHVNDFDPHYQPGVFREYVIGSRWFHTFQPSLVDLYRNGKYVGSRTTVDDSLRSGILPLNNTEADLTEGSIRQPAALFDKVLEPDLVERLYGNYQRSVDLSAIDIMRGRDAGLPPYNEYRKFCGLKVAKTFEDFRDTIDIDRVEMLKRLYDDVNDVDLMLAIYAEKLLPGSYLGATLYCIMTHNLLLWRKSDRFFFEHGDFPAALTQEQLHEVKQTSMARILCDNGDGIKSIQPRALLRKGPWNDFVPCEEIKRVDLTKWQDISCVAKKERKDGKNTKHENYVDYGSSPYEPYGPTSLFL